MSRRKIFKTEHLQRQVCSRHFATDQLIEPKTLHGRRRLVKGAVPTLFEWNHFTAQTPRASVWERRERPTEPVSREEQEEHIDVRDHDYCSTPEPVSLDMSSQATEDNSKTVEDLQKQLLELRVQREFCLQRFAGSDDNIRFNTRFPSYNHLMAFWFLIEPSIYKMVRVTRAISAAKRNEEVVTHARPSTRQLLQPIDEFFLFLCFLSVGLKERDLANRFNVHQSTVSRIIATWTICLYGGSVSDKEIFKQSGIAALLTENMAVMVDKGFLISDCCKCKVYCPPFLSKQMPAYQVRETQAIARLRVHVERVIRRIKENTIFDGVILLSHAFNINQLFAVACMLSNYQNKALVKKWVK
ncbi:hypothetical protein JOQ06_006234 [Pogonophryne albipinna]|uniref:THAP-type domain-containing protein n=1 Tax=Pogonophryne albipinna TaxID=1090488 RepID=A0AAD6FR03_9TELE|nr:hypothetical protein JOQ06_006234 [Pogonophryne albipinna]